MRLQKVKKPIIPLAYPFYFIPVLIISLVGFGDSIYLAISHYRNYADMGYQSFCAISKAINCDTVSQSPYSIFLDVPVPIWGIMGYGFYIFLLVFAWPAAGSRKRVWTLLMAVSLTFSFYSIILAFVSSYYIQSYCIMCILSYAVNLLLLFYSWIVRKRFACESFLAAIKYDAVYLKNYSKVFVPVASLFAISSLVMILAFPPYWHMNPPVLNPNIQTGITRDGHPWIGAERPELVITEFSDYLCFQCKKMHYFLRRLVENHPDKIRLIHRQFPMDKTINPLVTEPFHEGSAELAMFAIYAVEKGKFWEMNDFLFDISKNLDKLRIRIIAENTGLDFEEMIYIFREQRLWDILWNDIKEGIEVYQLAGTPGFIIEGQTYIGQIPSDILKPYINN